MTGRIIGTHQGIPIWEGTPSYEHWCETFGLDPNDDDNYNSYCEWKSNR